MPARQFRKAGGRHEEKRNKLGMKNKIERYETRVGDTYINDLPQALFR